MKLRNKKTGEIGYLHEGYVIVEQDESDLEPDERWFNSLAELNEEWEDYEEPKTAWFIDPQGDIQEWRDADCDDWTNEKTIGNYFNTREEAEKAVEKLKAWKRLKDKGFRFKGWTIDDGLRISICTNADEDDIYDDDKRRIKPDLDLLFGGEE